MWKLVAMYDLEMEMFSSAHLEYEQVWKSSSGVESAAQTVQSLQSQQGYGTHTCGTQYAGFFHLIHGAVLLSHYQKTRERQENDWPRA